MLLLAELVYGRNVQLPGEFYQCSGAPKTTTAGFVTRLQNTIQKLKPVMVRNDLVPNPFSLAFSCDFQSQAK